jgi:hypothetical protein
MMESGILQPSPLSPTTGRRHDAVPRKDAAAPSRDGFLGGIITLAGIEDSSPWVVHAASLTQIQADAR